ncbi:MAG: PRC-barrel domain-containing protein [Hyphomicrobiales bacterium]|nr:PRC-barrel domain-containing protein [Hyphomicrobiales bacterium]
MKKATIAVLVSSLALGVVAAPAFAQVAGGVTTSVQVNSVLAKGWSVKRTVLGQDIHDEKGVKIGDIDDVLVDKATGHAQPLVGVGGFLGIGEHYVAIDSKALRLVNNKLVWTGVTKDAVKAMPAIDRSKLPAGVVSLKKSVLGSSVHNAAKETVGKIEDVIIAPDGSASFAILSAGSYLAMDKHDVAIPISQFKMDGDFQLPNATKDMLRALPPFVYAH